MGDALADGSNVREVGDGPARSESRTGVSIRSQGPVTFDCLQFEYVLVIKKLARFQMLRTSVKEGGRSEKQL